MSASICSSVELSAIEEELGENGRLDFDETDVGGGSRIDVVDAIREGGTKEAEVPGNLRTTISIGSLCDEADLGWSPKIEVNDIDEITRLAWSSSSSKMN